MVGVTLIALNSSRYWLSCVSKLCQGSKYGNGGRGGLNTPVYLGSAPIGRREKKNVRELVKKKMITKTISVKFLLRSKLWPSGA